MERKRRLTPDVDRSPAPASPEPERGPAPISPEPRVPCALLLDVSGSMAGSAIKAITSALPQFRAAVLKDSLLTRKLSWAVIAFAESTTVLQGYGPVTGWEPPEELECGSGTAMGTAILKTLRLQKKHIDALSSQGVSIQHSFCFLVTDGCPNSEPPERFEEAAQLIEQTEKNHFSFFSIAVEGADIEMLRRLTPRRTPLMLADVKDFHVFLAWLGSSLVSVSRSKRGVEIELPNPLIIKPKKEGDPENPLGWAVVPPT